MTAYTWKAKIPNNQPVPARWKHDQKDWQAVCSFARSLKWRKAHGHAIAFSELALLFHFNGFRISGDFATLTMHDVICVVRQAFQYLIKDQSTQTCPGTLSATFVKSNGRVLPQSAIIDAVPWMHDEALYFVARTLCHGAGRTIESWRSPFLVV